MPVRPLTEADIPEVADLYWTYMRRRKGPAPEAVRASLHELYFTNPWSDSSLPCLVFEGKNEKVVGFLASFVRQMSVCGQPIRVLYGGNLVVHPEARSTLAAPRLLGKLLAGESDLWMADSANDISRTILERLGWRTIPVLNVHWARPLRPSQYAVHAVSRSMGSIASSGLKLAAKPFCAVADSMAAKLSFSPFRQTKPVLHGAELDVETLLQCFVEFRKGYSLWPEYDAHSLQWLLNFMERISTRGRLRKVVVRDGKQRVVGWYIYYVKPGAVGEVVQIGGEPKFTKDILDHLFYDAWEHGVAGLHGVADIRRMADFSDRNCIFTCRGGWMVAYSRKPELLELLERGDAMLSRLDGEWCLDPGD